MYQIKEESQQITFALFVPPEHGSHLMIPERNTNQVELFPKVHLFRFILFDDFL